MINWVFPTDHALKKMPQNHQKYEDCFATIEVSISHDDRSNSTEYKHDYTSRF